MERKKSFSLYSKNLYKKKTSLFIFAYNYRRLQGLQFRYELFKKTINRNKDNFIQQSHFEDRWNNGQEKNQIDEIQEISSQDDVSKKDIPKFISIDVALNNNRKIKNIIMDFVNSFAKIFNYKVNINKINKNLENIKETDDKNDSCDSILRKYKEFTINSYKKINK